MTIKASFNLPEEELDALRELAKERNTTVTQVLRQAIGTEKFIAEQVSNKNKLLIETPDHAMREVVFRT